jgi:predicted PP-loop superfamily ATPase
MICQSFGKICNKCVLPEARPEIWLNDEGVCNICVEYEKNRIACEGVRYLLESDLVRIIERNRGKGEYDCLVMCSGGKDSTAALYFMKKRFHTNPLAFTFDHGFETEGAMRNVRNAVEALGVDHLFFKTDYMREMFTDILKDAPKVALCHPCSIWYMDLTFRTAKRFKIPVIVAGWTKGQSTARAPMAKCVYGKDQSEFLKMGKATREFLEEYVRKKPKYKDFPLSMEDVLARAKKRHGAIVVSPHWFLPFETGEYTRLIINELNWKYPEISYPGRSTNCLLNFLSVHNSMKEYGYTHYHVEMSKLIRSGAISREEALRDLEITFGKDLLEEVGKKLSQNSRKEP